jgi:hypothetical protein
MVLLTREKEEAPAKRENPQEGCGFFARCASRGSGNARHNAHCPANDNGWRSCLSSCRAPFVIAPSTEILFQIIVGAWEISMIVAVKEARPITRGHFAKRGKHHGECFRGCGSLLHLGQERFIGLAYLCGFLLLIVGKKMRRTLDPYIPELYV